MREKFKKNFGNGFKKIMSVAGSVLLVGSTIGFAMAAGGSFPAPFVESNTPDYAIVVGTGAAASDMTGANSINTYLNTFYTVDSSETSDTSSTSTYTGDFSDAVGVVEDEVELGISITPPLKVSFTDSKIPTLLDTEVSWDDGEDSKKYDVHEEINILSNGLVLKTTLDDDELKDDVVLENSKALQYKYVFDDALNTILVGHEDADALYLTILGKEYEILDMDDNSITVSFSNEEVVKTGDKVTVDGVTLSIGDIFLGIVEVNSVLIKEGYTRTINGIEVYVDTIAYHSYSGSPSKAIIKIGKDISQTINDGDEYTADNEVGYDDETWVWDINNLGDANGYIGVIYDINSVSYDDDEDEDNAITVGQSYALPENYGAVVFEGLTNVDYEDFELSFDDRDLYAGNSSTKVDDENVAILEGENDDSITLNVDGIGLVETDSIYFRNNVTSETKLYFKDIDGDIDDDHEGRIQLAINPTDVKMIVGDNEMVVTFDNESVTLTNSEESIKIALGNDGTNFDGLGVNDENAEANDVKVGEISIGTRDDDVFTHYGLFIKNPESNADSDRVVLSIPDEQVYAKISVKGQGMAVELSDTENTMEGNETVVGNETEVVVIPQVGGIVIRDNEVASHTGKNLIIVGGSCINAEAARLLGGPACGSDFTLQTGIIAGKALVKSFDDGERVAIVIAGFHAADTTKAVSSFIGTDMDVAIGKQYIV